MTGESDGRGVDKGHRQFDVVIDNAEEEILVPLQQPHQVDVSVEVVLTPLQILEGNGDLVRLGLDRRGEETEDPQLTSLFYAER